MSFVLFLSREICVWHASKVIAVVNMERTLSDVRGTVHVTVASTVQAYQEKMKS